MTEKMIDITNDPSKWRDGDKVNYKFLGRESSGVLWWDDTGWYEAATAIRYKEDGRIPAPITDLRVTRPAPVLPEEDRIVVQWYRSEDKIPYTAEYWTGGWKIAGHSDTYTTEELREVIGTCELWLFGAVKRLGDER